MQRELRASPGGVPPLLPGQSNSGSQSQSLGGGVGGGGALPQSRGSRRRSTLPNASGETMGATGSSNLVGGGGGIGPGSVPPLVTSSRPSSPGTPKPGTPGARAAAAAARQAAAEAAERAKAEASALAKVPYPVPS